MFSLSQKTGRNVFLIGLIVFTNWLHSKFLEHKENIIENPFKSEKRRFPRINSQRWRVQTDEAKTKTSILFSHVIIIIILSLMQVFCGLYSYRP